VGSGRIIAPIMTHEEKQLFINLLFSHKNLLITFQEYRYLQEHPEADWETVHERSFEEADEVYQSLSDALLEGKPLEDALQTILLQAKLIQAEVLKNLKGE
jgi:hypothetical protein